MKYDYPDLWVIMPGNEFRSAVGVGEGYAFFKKYDINRVHTMIGSSGGIGGAAHLAIGKLDETILAWGGEVTTKGMFSQFPRPTLHIGYLIDVLKNNYGVQPNELYDTTTNILTSAFNRTTGKITHFANDGSIDFYDAMWATKSVPVVADNSRIPINGHEYCDAPLSAGSKLHVKYAVEHGAKYIVVLENIPNPEEKDRFDYLFSLWLKLLPKTVEKEYKKQQRAVETFKIPKEVNIHTVIPSVELCPKGFTNEAYEIHRSIKGGVITLLEDKNLEAFMKACPKKKAK